MKERLKIMIVDDDGVSLGVASAVLEDAGHQVTQRESALGTMVAVQREKPDIVLLDVHMPGLSGDSLTTLLSDAKLAHQPIVILHSSTAGTELAALAQSCKAAGCIEKTTDHAAFLLRFDAIVSRALRERGEQRGTSPRVRIK